MSAQAVLAALIRHSATTLTSMAARLSDKDFFQIADRGPSVAWTLLHLSGQLAWASEQTTQQSSHLPSDLLGRFKGDGSVSDFSADVMPPRNEILDYYEQAVDLSLAILGSIDSAQLCLAPASNDAAKVYPTVAALWTDVGWHGYWHLGNLSAAHASLKDARVSQPRVFLDGALI